MASSKIVPLTCHGHSRPVTHLSFSSVVDDDQYCLISACKDNNPMLRDGVTGDWIGTFIGHKGAVWHSKLSSKADLAATGSADFTAKVWNTHTGECLHTLQHGHIVRAVAFDPSTAPNFLATGGFEKKLRVFDLGSPSASSPPTTSGPADGTSAGRASPSSYEVGAGVHGGTIKSIVWGPDQHVLVTAADDKKVRWWDLRQSEPICTFDLEGNLGSCELNTIAGKRNGSSSILAVGAGKHAYFFSGSTPGQLIATHKTPHEIASLAINFEEKRFVTGSTADTWVRVYDFNDGKELNVHKGHHGPVWSTSFAPDGKLYATGSEDGTVKLWKLGKEPYGLWR